MAVITPLRRNTSSQTIASELDAFLADLQERRGRAPNTINASRYALRTAAHALPQPLAAITTSQIEQFLANRHEKPSTSNRRLASLKRFFRWACKAGLCHHNPAELV